MSKSLVKKLAGISLILLIIISVAGYVKMGGLNPVQTELVRVDNYYFLGRFFEGRFKSDTVRNYFNEMRVYVQDSTIEGHPVIIYDSEPRGKRGISKIFIGIKLTDPSLNTGQHAADLQEREIKASQAIRLVKDAHISVMPNPSKIGKRITSFAEQHHLDTQGPSIEIYHSNSRLVIEQPVRSMVE